MASMVFGCSNVLVAQAMEPIEHSILIEYGGGTDHFSINYGRLIFSGPRLSGNVRVGISIWETGVAIPLGLHSLLGHGQHGLFADLILAPVSLGLRFWDRDESDIMMDITLGLGYQYRSRSKNWFAAIGFFPFIRLDPTYQSLTADRTSIGIRPGFRLGTHLGK